MRKTLVTALTATTLGLAACSGGAGDEPEATPESRTTDEAERTATEAGSRAIDDSEKASDALQAAIIETADTEFLDFSYVMRFGDEPMISSEGVQRLSGGWSATTTTNDPSTPGEDEFLGLEARSTGGTTWMQMQAWPAPMNGCWLELNPGDVPVGIYGLQPDEAGYVTMLAAMEAREFEDGSNTRIVVDIKLRNAQMLFHGPVIEQIELPEPAWTSTLVPATVEIEDDRVHSIEMSGSALVDAVTRAGGTIEDEAHQTLVLTDSVVTYASSVDATVAGPPPANLVVTEAEAEQGCH